MTCDLRLGKERLLKPSRLSKILMERNGRDRSGAGILKANVRRRERDRHVEEQPEVQFCYTT